MSTILKILSVFVVIIAAFSYRYTSTRNCTAFTGDISKLNPGDKVVHLIRHAQGGHNAAFLTHGRGSYDSELYFDTDITDLGRKQARDLHKIIREKQLPVDIVVVSPLSRTIQTAKIAFSGMNKDFVSVEEARERIGVHPCDRRRPTSELKKLFSYVDFSNVVNEEDMYWRKTVRESDAEITVRANRLLKWLKERPETHIALVSHSSLLTALTNFGDLRCDLRVDVSHFNNSEIRSIIMSQD